MLLKTAEALLFFPAYARDSLPSTCGLSTALKWAPEFSHTIISIHKQIQFISSSFPAPPKSQLNRVCHREVGRTGVDSLLTVCVCVCVCMCELLSHSGHEFTLPHPRRGQLPPGFAKMLLFPRNLKYSKGTVTLWFATSPDHNIYLVKWETITLWNENIDGHQQGIG